MDPPPAFFSAGTAAPTDQKTLFTLMSKQRWNSEIVTSSVGFIYISWLLLFPLPLALPRKLLTDLVLIACPCVIDYRVESAPLRDARINSGLPVVLRGHVHFLNNNILVCAANLLGGCLSARLVDVANEDATSFLGEALRDCCTEAGTAAWEDDS